MGIGLDDFGNDLFGPDGEVLGKAVFADAAGALLTLEVCAGGALGLLLRCGLVAGGAGLFRRLPGEEVGMIELLALAAEELPLEPVKLLGEDRDLILQLLVLLLKFFVRQSADRYAFPRSVSQGKNMILCDYILLIWQFVPGALHAMLEVDSAEQHFEGFGF